MKKSSDNLKDNSSFSQQKFNSCNIIELYMQDKNFQ